MHASSSEPSSLAASLLHDPDRIRAVQRYNALDAEIDQDLQDVAKIASVVFEVPRVAIALIGADWQWLKACIGIEAPQVPANDRVGLHVLNAGAPVVIRDAAADPRFANSPLVAGAPPAWLVAGTPLMSPDGHALGILAVMDPAERTLSEPEADRLTTLGRMVVDRLEVRCRMEAATQARDRLEAEEARLQGLTDAMPGVIFQFCAYDDGTRGLNFVSQQAADVLGLDPAPEDFFERFTACIPEDHRARFLNSVDTAVQQGTVWDFEMTFRRPDGPLRWIHGRAAPEVRSDRVVHNGVLIDVTERVESQQRFRQFAEQTNDIISLHSADGSYLYVSPAADPLTGYTPQELIGRNAFSFIHPGDRAHVREQQAQALDGADVRFDYRLVRADGTPLWVETTGSTIHTGDDTVELLAATRSIHERKQAERALEASRRALEEERQWLEMAVLGGDLGLWDCDYNTGHNTVNERWASMLGYTLDEVEPTFDFFRSLVHPDDLPHLMDALATYVERGQPFMESECRMQAADGTWRWILSRGRIVEWNDDGTPKRAVGTHMDITERKQQEEDLRASKVALEQAQRITKTGNFTWHVAHDAIELSTEAGHLLGLDATVTHTPEDLIALVHPDDRARFRDQLAHLRAGLKHSVEYRMVPSGDDSAVRWMEGRGQPEFDAAGQVVRVLATLADVTEQKRQASIKQRFGRLLEAAASEIYIFRADTLVFEQVNEGACANLGYSRDVLQEMTPLDLKPHTEAEFRALLQPLIDETVAMQVFETTHERADGSAYPVEVRLQLSSRETTPVFIAIVTDITDRKRYEAGLIEAKERAEEASRIKSAVVANMSHEVRTPLTSIIGFAEILEDEVATDQQKRFAVLIQQSSKRLLATLNSVLHLSRLEAERQPLKRTHVDGAAIAQDVADAYRTQAAQEGLTLEVDAPAPCPLISDADMLSRTLTNLVSNSIKFTEPGGTVTLSVVPHGGAAVHFSVTDTGLGMSEEFQTRMFEAFEQESTGTDRAHEGSGLGLTIVKRLVDLLDGTLTVRSQKGRGSQFDVRIPTTPPEASA